MLRFWCCLSFFSLLFAPGSLCRAELGPKGGKDLVPPAVFSDMQGYMLEFRFDGWMFTGDGAFDDLQQEFLGLHGQTTHRWFIFYPAISNLHNPFLIYHPEDESVFSGVNCYPLPYRSRDEMIQRIKDKILSISKKICMNYSNQLNIPEISRSDAGAMELIASLGLQVISSGSILSFYNTRWLNSHVETHKQAATVLCGLWPQVTGYLKERILKGKKTTDYDLRSFVEERLKKMGLAPVCPPTVAVGASTLQDAYVPQKRTARAVSRGDLFYLEVSARDSKDREAMYASLGWSAVVDTVVPDSLSRPWEKVVAAADEMVGILERRIPQKRPVSGMQVDQAARGLIGASPDIVPRPLGFNLNPYGHRFGVCFDNYWAHDDREIHPGLGFTVEPGYYTPHYALRMCNNLLVQGDRQIYLSAPIQRKLTAVLAANP